MGLGHELLQEVRNAAAEAYGLRKWQDSSHGMTDMQKVGRSQKSVAKPRNKTVSAYTRNWKRIEALLNGPWIGSEEGALHLKGLQKLDPDKDVKYYLEPRIQTSSFVIQGAHDISWIWQVAMLGTSPGDRPGITSALAAWEDGRASQMLFHLN